MKLILTILIIVICSFPGHLYGQVNSDEKLNDYSYHLHKMIPRQAKFQFAGSMGMFSIGPGWYYGKKAQWETDLFVGFIPRIDNMKGHVTVTLKQIYTPFRVELNHAVSYEPLTTGIYVNKIFGPYFWNKLPEKYPNNYYFWATNTRFNIFLGQAVSYQPPNGGSDNWSFFYEINTNDLYILSAIGNRIIKITDIINLSFGLRYRIF